MTWARITHHLVCREEEASSRLLPKGASGKCCGLFKPKTSTANRATATYHALSRDGQSDDAVDSVEGRCSRTCAQWLFASPVTGNFT